MEFQGGHLRSEDLHTEIVMFSPDNEPEPEEAPSPTRREMRFSPVKDVDHVLDLALLPATEALDKVPTRGQMKPATAR